MRQVEVKGTGAQVVGQFESSSPASPNASRSIMDSLRNVRNAKRVWWSCRSQPNL